VSKAKKFTPEETFRVLARKTMPDVYPEIQKRISDETTVVEMLEIIKEYGYTFQEYLNYDMNYTKRN